MVIAVPKYKLDEYTSLRKELYKHAEQVRDATDRYEYVPKDDRLFVILSLLEKHLIPYGIHSEKDWRSPHPGPAENESGGYPSPGK